MLWLRAYAMRDGVRGQMARGASINEESTTALQHEIKRIKKKK